jgi:hypothetical protein
MPVAGRAAVIAAVALYAVSPLILTSLKLSVYDMTLPLEAAKNPSFAPVITDIDERSPATVRQWPWPRFTVAAIDSEAASFTGNARQSDDVTVLALKKTRKSQIVRTARAANVRGSFMKTAKTMTYSVSGGITKVFKMTGFMGIRRTESGKRQ